MSCSIHWRPASDTGKHFRNGTSTTLGNLHKTFGNTIRESDVPALRAMHNATGDRFYEEVADTIEQVGDIEVWGEY